MKKRVLILFGLVVLVLFLAGISADSQPACQQVGTGNEGWYQNEQLVTYANCTNCKAVCDATGTAQEGWYNSCYKSLIKYETCYVKCYNDAGCPNAEYKSYCDANKACTEKKSYICENSGTTSSQCVLGTPSVSCIDCYYGCENENCKKQPAIRCYKDSDCPTTATSNSHCKGLEACTETYSPKCINAGTSDAACSYEESLSCTLCPKVCENGYCVEESLWRGMVHIEIVENICEPCPPSTGKEKETACRCDSTKLYNAKVSLYDSVGNLLGSGDTSRGYLEFSRLKEGRYTASLYAEGYNQDKAEIIVGKNTGNYHTISLTKSGSGTGDIKIAVQDKITRNILTNAGVVIYDSSGNFVNSGSTSGGGYHVIDASAAFSNLKEGEYTASASAAGYINDKIEFKIIGGDSDYLIIELVPLTTQPVPTTPAYYWFRNAYWQCYDGYEEKSGGENLCKPAEVWKNYADEACKNHCYSDKSKCGMDSFSVYNECPGSSVIQVAVCGNGICESGEGEICKISASSCQEGKKCEGKEEKCYYKCEQDCKREEKYIYANLEEKFKMQMSQEVRFTDYTPLEIKFNDLFVPGCIKEETTNQTTVSEEKKATIEKYTPLTGKVISATAGESGGAAQSTECKEAEPYAVLQIKQEFEPEKITKTEVIKLKIGEKKKFSDIYAHNYVISFMDYDTASKTGVFLVSKNAAGFSCPEKCICDLAGNVTECKKIQECSKKTMLCPNGACRENCLVEDITTECKFGCFYNNKCLPYGLRVSKLYCSIEDNMKSQLEADEICENNFECRSNLCIDDMCVSSGLFKKILNWFKVLFGGGEKEKIVDCGADTECWENAFKICKPAKISQEGSNNQEGGLGRLVIEIIGLEDKKCAVKWTAKMTAGDESMTCKFENYTLGVTNVGSGSMEQYCSGELVYWLAAAPTLARAEAPMQNFNVSERPVQ